MTEGTTLISLKNAEQYGKLPKILVMGVGGGGCNAINNMMKRKIEGVEFIAVNTDMQCLANSMAPKIIQLGKNTTKGQGAGSYPEIALAAAEESKEEIEDALKDVELLFLTAGMGGGTGTGATPYIAKLAKEKDILTVAVVTKPFQYEAEVRLRIAEQGIAELRKYVDTMIVLPNENLFRIANKETTLQDAFACSDNVLYLGVKGITDLITTPGLINLDFADVRMVIKKMGRAMMGMGEGEGEDRAIKAVEEALSNPLLEDVNIKGATGALINITGSPDMTLFEFDEAAKRIREEIGSNKATIKVGTAFSKDLEGKVRVSIFATGMQETFPYDNLEEQKEPETTNKDEEENNIGKNKVDEDMANNIANIFTDTKKEEKNETVIEQVRINDNKEKSENVLTKQPQQRSFVSKTRLSAQKDGDYFDMSDPQIEEVIVEDNKKNNSVLFGFFNNFSSKKNKEEKKQQNTSVFETKNKKIEIRNNNLDDVLDNKILDIPTYLRNKKI